MHKLHENFNREITWQTIITGAPKETVLFRSTGPLRQYNKYNFASVKPAKISCRISNDPQNNSSHNSQSRLQFAIAHKPVDIRSAAEKGEKTNPLTSLPARWASNSAFSIPVAWSIGSAILSLTGKVNNILTCEGWEIHRDSLFIIGEDRKDYINFRL